MNAFVASSRVATLCLCLQLWRLYSLAVALPPNSALRPEPLAFSSSSLSAVCQSSQIRLTRSLSISPQFTLLLLLLRLAACGRYCLSR